MAECSLDNPCAKPCIDSIQRRVAVNTEGYRNHLSHVVMDVAPPHISNANRGYGRGIDGLFYNS